MLYVLKQDTDSELEAVMEDMVMVDMDTVMVVATEDSCKLILMMNLFPCIFSQLLSGFVITSSFSSLLLLLLIVSRKSHIM